MEKVSQSKNDQPKTRRVRDLVNTPFKKAMFVIQIISYVLIPGSPIIGGGIGVALKLSAASTGGLILAIFILGEILFYGSLLFLGKELVLLVKDKIMNAFRKKGKD